MRTRTISQDTVNIHLHIILILKLRMYAFQQCVSQMHLTAYADIPKGIIFMFVLKLYTIDIIIDKNL